MLRLMTSSKVVACCTPVGLRVFRTIQNKVPASFCCARGRAANQRRRRQGDMVGDSGRACSIRSSAYHVAKLGLILKKQGQWLRPPLISDRQCKPIPIRSRCNTSGVWLSLKRASSAGRRTIYGQSCELIPAAPEPIEGSRRSWCVRVSPMKQGSTFRRSEDCVLKLTAMRIPTNGPRIPN